MGLHYDGPQGKIEAFWGTSTDSWDEATKNAVKEAEKALPGKNLEAVEVIDYGGGFLRDEKNGKMELQFQILVHVSYSGH